MAAKAKAAKTEREFHRWLAWHVAALPRAKDFPDLGQFVTGVKAPATAQTPEEMKSVVSTLFGSVVEAPCQDP